MTVTFEDDSVRNTAIDAIGTLMNTGQLYVQDNAGGICANLAFSAVAFAAAASGTAAAGTITADASADGGTASIAFLRSSASSDMISCAVSTGGPELVLANLVVGGGATVTCSSLKLTMPTT